jgi:hypothetical protein
LKKDFPGPQLSQATNLLDILTDVEASLKKFPMITAKGEISEIIYH